MTSMVPLVLSVSLVAGACAPSTKPAGYGVGSVLAVAGTGLLLHATSQDCSSKSDWDLNLDCKVEAIGEGALGTAIGVTGLVILLAALASPSEPAASSAPKVALPAAPVRRVDPEQPREGQLVPRVPARAGVRLAFP
jgi:hypothetical protein